MDQVISEDGESFEIFFQQPLERVPRILETIEAYHLEAINLRTEVIGVSGRREDLVLFLRNLGRTGDEIEFIEGQMDGWERGGNVTEV